MHSAIARKHMPAVPRQLEPRGILFGALALEAALFSFLAPSFFTLGNFFEITRLSTELGLLAIAMTPVLITGGIDLSVGAMMGLSAVVLGAAWHDWQLPLPAAVL